METTIIILSLRLLLAVALEPSMDGMHCRDVYCVETLDYDPRKSPSVLVLSFAVPWKLNGIWPSDSYDQPPSGEYEASQHAEISPAQLRPKRRGKRLAIQFCVEAPFLGKCMSPDRNVKHLQDETDASIRLIHINSEELETHIEATQHLNERHFISSIYNGKVPYDYLPEDRSKIVVSQLMHNAYHARLPTPLLVHYHVYKVQEATHVTLEVVHHERDHTKRITPLMLREGNDCLTVGEKMYQDEIPKVSNDTQRNCYYNVIHNVNTTCSKTDLPVKMLRPRECRTQDLENGYQWNPDARTLTRYRHTAMTLSTPKTPTDGLPRAWHKGKTMDSYATFNKRRIEAFHDYIAERKKELNVTHSGLSPFWVVVYIFSSLMALVAFFALGRIAVLIFALTTVPAANAGLYGCHCTGGQATKQVPFLMTGDIDAFTLTEYPTFNDLTTEMTAMAVIGAIVAVTLLINLGKWAASHMRHNTYRIHYRTGGLQYTKDYSYVGTPLTATEMHHARILHDNVVVFNVKRQTVLDTTDNVLDEVLDARIEEKLNKTSDRTTYKQVPFPKAHVSPI